ncbi:hypothetical protein [Saccharomonospora halophila]|uniref:hypothetical protein n=1 Tax=Saccharomonospora halophila TaxID=129922 RepID=UPI00037E9DC1|nr:hypothetical protein [Saccharomonospora halophila]
MFKKSAIVATAAAGLLAIGSPALATAPGDKETNVEDNTSQFGLINVDDVLSHNNIGICDVLDVGVGILGVGNSQGNSTCIATAEN